jgi:protein-tyrosine-phosphatase
MKPKVLFICLGNSCRSIMAEAITRSIYGEVIEAASAGLKPLGFITPETLEVLAEAGIATTGLRSKGLAEINLEGCRLLVNLSYHSLASLIPASLEERVLQRPVVDPYGGGLEIYRQARDAIRSLIAGEIVPLLLSS